MHVLTYTFSVCGCFSVKVCSFKGAHTAQIKALFSHFPVGPGEKPRKITVHVVGSKAEK
jgi:hypothetical protein